MLTAIYYTDIKWLYIDFIFNGLFYTGYLNKSFLMMS